MNYLAAGFRALLAATPLAVAPAFAAPPVQGAPPAQQIPPLKNGQIDSLMAPIALYPDALLSKVLIATTFPDQVIDAAHWLKANPTLKGEALDRAIAAKSWDTNVKALAHVPGVLDMMSGQQDWMYQVGGAFVRQQKDVMASVQRLRKQASAHGSLKSTPQQKVVQRGSTIVIEPTVPNTVYVPYYNPTVVYGAWAYPAYRPYYWPSPYGAFATGLAWGAGVALSTAFWSNAFDWGHYNVWYGGGWYGNGAWNHGYYNSWHNNYYHYHDYHGNYHNGGYHDGGYHGGDYHGGHGDYHGGHGDYHGGHGGHGDYHGSHNGGGHDNYHGNHNGGGYHGGGGHGEGGFHGGGRFGGGGHFSGHGGGGHFGHGGHH
jgi:Protein of unknown function (DUF3300)